MGKLIFNAQSTPVAPVGENKHTMFVDSCDGKLKMEDSGGNVCTISDNNDINCIYNKFKSNVVNMFLVGGGAGGQGGSGTGGGGGGAGGYVKIPSKTFLSGAYNIIVGNGGLVGCNGGDTIVDGIIAYGGGICCRFGGSAGGNGGCAILQQGNIGGGFGYNGNDAYTSGGGGGALSAGRGGNSSASGGTGGCGCTFDELGYPIHFSMGGGGAGYSAGGANGGFVCYNDECIMGGGCGGHYKCPSNQSEGTNGICYGSGGGGRGGCGYHGVAIIYYPECCNYNITGGTITCCNGFKIHTFTTNGILCIN